MNIIKQNLAADYLTFFSTALNVCELGTQLPGTFTHNPRDILNLLLHFQILNHQAQKF